MKFIMALVCGVGVLFYSVAVVAQEEVVALEDIVVESGHDAPLTTHYTSPSLTVTELDAQGINATTIDDFIKYQPGLIVRRRYIGDPNATLGMRGSNMFQTTRSMVFADGLPLHYLLQSRFNGAPRWSLVAPDETQAVEVVYGPFSAEYSGNAMGGVVNIETKLPTERVFHAEGAVFAQDFDVLGTEETYTGHREFLSYGDRFGDVSVYLFHNRLENESQPMSFRFSGIEAPAGGETAVSGAIGGRDATGEPVMYYGDTGAENVVTNLTKFKLGYDMGDWLARFTLAYEDRDRETDSPNNYLRDDNDNTVWSGDVVSGGDAFSVRGSNFAVSEQNRETLLVGAGVEGPLAGTWRLDANVSVFDVLEDRTLSSGVNPDDPSFDGAGRVRDYEDTGWTTLDVKARTDRFLGRRDMNVVAGYHFDRYSLEVHDFNSDDFAAGEKTSDRSATGGKTNMNALFAQWGWDFIRQWDVALGGRYERWESEDGFFHNFSSGDIQNHDDRSESAFSPKFSLGFTPDKLWRARYSVARAYRFPIVEELYQNEFRTNETLLADAELDPEAGLHHNVMLEHDIPRGRVRINLFHETIEDVIFNQAITLADSTTLSTFLPIDEVTTTGVELMARQDRVLNTNLDVQFNLSYLDAEITGHKANPDIEGNVMPRMPEWRGNVLATYHVSDRWDGSAGLRYASDSFGTLDNSDKENDVFGAQDAYTFIDLKTTYRITPDAQVSAGIDNVTNEEAYVFHPWPRRTFYVEGSISF